MVVKPGQQRRKMYVSRLRHTKMRMVRWMCDASLNNRPGGIRTANEEFKSRMGLECISDVLRRGRLRWFRGM